MITPFQQIYSTVIIFSFSTGISMKTLTTVYSAHALRQLIRGPYQLETVKLVSGRGNITLSGLQW